MNWKTLTGIVISAVFLFFAFRKVDIHEINLAFRSVEYIYLIPIVFLLLSSFWLRAVRWKYLLQPVKTIKISSLFSAAMIGFMANNLLPARLGEFVRAYAIGEKEKISKSSSLATIVVERILDGFTLLLFLAFIFVFWSFSFPGWLRSTSYLALVFYVFAVLFLILLKVRTKVMLSISEYIIRPLPGRVRRPFIKIMDSFVGGLNILHSVKDIILSIILSVIIWLHSVAVIYILLISFGINISVFASFLLLVALGIGVMVPSAPGFVGTIQIVCVAVLSLFTVSKSEALSFSIIYHAVTFIPVTAIGLIYLFKEEISFAEFKKMRRNIGNN